ncbi:hypothetical protein [Nonomuraea sp. NPDC049141]|uniref:hypothetical protein n=1 Tax=unclassified Nonomuraea TaxID=2593643 RepID=UPI0033F8FDB7
MRPRAFGIYTLVTNRLPRPLIGKRAQYEPRRYGLGQLLMGLFSVFLALSNMVMGWSHGLSLALIFLAIGCTMAGSWFLFSAMSSRRAP